jgi:hypothetical protein
MADFISGLLGMGDEDPMQRARNAGLLGLGASLLQAGAPSLTPQSLGAALGQGVMTGQQMSSQAMQQARQQQIQQQMMGTMGGLGEGQTGDVGAKIAQLQKMALLDPKNQAAYLKIAEQLQGKAPVFTGEVSNAALNLFGTNDVSKLDPEQRQQDVAAAEQARVRAAAAGAPSVNVSYGRTFAQDLAGEQIKDLAASNQSAQAAVTTLQTVSDLKPLLDSGVYSGPGANTQVLLAQIGQKLGVGGSDRAQVLQNTAVAMQQLAQLELQAASQMKGQGALTEGERTILRRAAGGTLDKFTAPEVKALVSTLEKTAKYRVQSHNSKIDQLSTMQPDAARMLGAMRVNPIPPNVIVREIP